MKKIFTLALGVLMTALLFAADRRPSVILNSARNYEVVIDGRSYYTNGRTMNLDHLNFGRHTIRVFEVKKGYFLKQRKMVSQASFRLGSNDVKIRISFSGDIQFKEARNFGSRNRDRDWNDDNYGWNRGDNDVNDRDFRNERDTNNDRDDKNGRDDRTGRDDKRDDKNGRDNNRF